MPGISLRFTNRARGYATLAFTTLGLAFFLWWVNRFYPVRQWLFFRYAGYALTAVTLLFLSASAGDYAIRKLRGARLPLREHLVQSVAVGVLAFGVGWFVLGVLGLMGPVTAIAWPVGLGAPHLWPFFKYLRRARRVSRYAPLARRRSLLWYGALGLGVLGLGLVYLPLLSPENIAFDTRWYHQAIAEHYAADGGIAPFREGWLMGAYPQLASYLYSWAYALPGTILFDRIELALHLEFALFVYTLASVTVLARRLAPGAPVALSWVALFAFPELFCYDSLLAGAADHIAAAFAVPLFLALLRVLPELRLRECLLLGVLAGGVLLTKYSVYAMVLVAGAAVFVRGVWLGVRQRRLPAEERSSAWLVGPLAIAGVALVASAPHWLKNVLWYKDPLYPLLRSVFPSEPWPASAEEKMSWFIPAEWVAERSWKGVVETLKAAFTFSFVPRDWWSMHRDVPIFGSLFTLSIPCLFLVRRSGRLVLLYVAVHVCVMQWFWSFHQDRYLQSYVPWMAAGIAALAARLWQYGWPARLGVSSLFVTQLVWGGDVPFFPTHSMSGSALKTSIDLLSTGHRGDVKNRLRVLQPWNDIGKALPPGSRVLIHDEQVHLGIGASSVSDAGPWQTAIDYAAASSPARVYDLLKGYGITHVLWVTDRSYAFSSLGSDVAFFDFALNTTRGAKRYGGHTLARMPSSRPSLERTGYTALFGCNDTYDRGLYKTSRLVVLPLLTPRPKSDFPKPDEAFADFAEFEAARGKADAIVFNPRCATGAPRSFKGFVFAAQRGEDRIYVRNAPRP